MKVYTFTNVDSGNVEAVLQLKDANDMIESMGLEQKCSYLIKEHEVIE